MSDQAKSRQFKQNHVSISSKIIVKLALVFQLESSNLLILYPSD